MSTSTSLENQQKVRALFASMAKGPLPMAPDEIDPWEVSLYEKWKLTDQLLPWTDFRAEALKKKAASSNPPEPSPLPPEEQSPAR
jgi:hypothetical protein